LRMSYSASNFLFSSKITWSPAGLLNWMLFIKRCS
jgi:hypothetical protein